MQKKNKRSAELVDSLLKMSYEEKKKRAKEAIKVLAKRSKRASG